MATRPGLAWRPRSAGRVLLLVAVSLIFLGPGRAVAATRVPALPVVVRSSPGLGSLPLPVTLHVPFARGSVRGADDIWLHGDQRQPFPLQATILERWEDGSVRWLLLDALVPLAPDGTTRLLLERGGAPSRATGRRLRRTRDKGRLLVDTGVLRATVPADGGAIAAQLATPAGPAVDRIDLPQVTIAGQRLSPTSFVPMRIETDGDVRTEILLRAQYPGGLDLDTRVAFFAGQTWMRLQLTLTHRGSEPWMPIESLALTIPFAATRGSTGIDGTRRDLAMAGEPHVLFQRDVDEVLLDGSPVGTAGDGWLRAESATSVVTVVRRWFREEYPQALELAAGGIRVDLVAGRGEPVRLGRGAARTIELAIDVASIADAGDPAARAAALRAAPAGLPPGEWIAASGALPQAVDPRDPDVARFLGRLASAIRRYRARARHERWDDGPARPCAERPVERPRQGFFGLLHWGDWNFPGYRDENKGCDAWGNLEYDLPQVLGLAWAASNAPEDRETFVAAVRHYRDVDLIHHDPEHPERVGLNHPHKVGHHDPEARQSVDLGHTWVEGLLTHWRLSGEIRSREAAVRLAEALAGRLDKAGNPRHFGWPMIALAAVAQSTGETRFRDAARQYAHAAIAAFPPTPEAGDWKIGILADGLAAVDALGEDRPIRDWLLAYADRYLEEPGRFADPRYALPLGYLAAVTNNPRYARAARAVADALSIGDWGKVLAAEGRIGFRLLGPLRGLSGAQAASDTPSSTTSLPGRVVPPPASERARPQPSRSRARPRPHTAR